LASQFEMRQLFQKRTGFWQEDQNDRVAMCTKRDLV